MGLAAAACTPAEYDDTAIKEQIGDLNDRLTAVEEDLATLQLNVDGMKTLAQALKDGKYITSAEKKDGVCTITFSDKTTIVVTDGEDLTISASLFGFNASIEASRAKESGKGFGVIAQEVRNLAETSKSSADKIEKTMQHIGEYSKEMNEQVVNTKDAVNKCLEDLNSFSALLTELKASSAE